MNKRGILAIISGFSGAGKGTVVNKLLEKDNYAVSISATTREPRQGEVDGKNYFFKSRDEFENMIENNQLIEYAEYVGNYYGTPRDYVFKKLEEGYDVILEIEMQGALKVKEKFPETALIFITPPSADELKKRLVGRGTETIEQIDKRMSRAVDECDYMNKYDYIVVNDDLDECVDEIHRLLQSIHNAKENQSELIEKITEELKKFK
ncbi:MAG: guanylate kinase [Christensenellales bacterium]|jgi:guanylate kinase|uniref:guanylate kinase n=1 Tax=Butyribacter sp. TaxID=2822465 RepID=UPI002A981620|nr:guanylate kinase [Clostridium sp.]MDY5181626.1 guanylate kinase [Butyribacter sp.]